MILYQTSNHTTVLDHHMHCVKSRLLVRRCALQMEQAGVTLVCMQATSGECACGIYTGKTIGRWMRGARVGIGCVLPPIGGEWGGAHCKAEDVERALSGRSGGGV